MFQNKAIKQLIGISSVIALVCFVTSFHFSPIAAVLGLLGMTGIFTLFMMETKSRYKDIADLSKHLRRIINESQPKEKIAYREGELGILQTEIGKITSKLSYQAEYLNDEKERMADALSNISHQMKTPLAAISIMIDLLESPNLPPDKQTEFLQNIRMAQYKMQWQVESLLKMAKIDADAIIMKPDFYPLADVVQKASDLVSILMELKNQKLILEPSPLCKAKCDIDWTAEALGNILKNCAEYTDDGGVISVSQGENPLYNWICVVGGGKGIPKEDLPYIFQRFYKGKNSEKDSTGIGLPMSLLILKKQNGDIEVENKVGGVQFAIKFYKG